MSSKVLRHSLLLLGLALDSDNTGISGLHECGGQEFGYRGCGRPHGLYQRQPGHRGQTSIDWRHSSWRLFDKYRRLRPTAASVAQKLGLNKKKVPYVSSSSFVIDKISYL